MDPLLIPLLSFLGSLGFAMLIFSTAGAKSETDAALRALSRITEEEGAMLKRAEAKKSEAKDAEAQSTSTQRLVALLTAD